MERDGESMPELRKAGVRKETLLAGSDMLACVGSIALALYVRFGADVPHAHRIPYLTYWPVLLFLRMVMAYAFGLYDFKHRLTVADHAFNGCGAALAGVVPGYIFLALVQLYRPADAPLYARLSRLVALIDAAILAAWFAVSRTAVLALLQRLGYQVRLALVGPNDKCARLADEIHTHGPKPVRVAGVIVSDAATTSSCARQLEELARQTQIDQAILASAEIPQQELRDLLLLLDQSRAEVFLYPELDVPILATTNVFSIAGVPLLSLNPALAMSPYRFFKRFMDVAVALVGLVLALPVCAAAALAVRCASPGPALFSQERMGLRGRRFRVYKLRTMRADAEAGSGPVLSTKDDPRIMPVGRRLRRFRIDELPQLWNVVLGHMSLVGPRPERPEFVERFVRENPLYERRLLVRPGLTGLAQIHGRYDTDYTHKLRYDLIYINSVSFAQDLRILLATIRTVLTGKGAV